MLHSHQHAKLRLYFRAMPLRLQYHPQFPPSLCKSATVCLLSLLSSGQGCRYLWYSRSMDFLFVQIEWERHWDSKVHEVFFLSFFHTCPRRPYQTQKPENCLQEKDGVRSASTVRVQLKQIFQQDLSLYPDP